MNLANTLTELSRASVKVEQAMPERIKGTIEMLAPEHASKTD